MIYVNLYGGLGNQIFEYAVAKAISITKKQKISLITSSLTNIGNDILSIHLLVKNVDCTILNEIPKNEIHFIQKIVLTMFYYLRDFYKKENNYQGLYKFEKFIQPLLNIFSLYMVSNGYIRLNFNGKKIFKNSYLEGHFQSPKYFENIRSLLISELNYTITNQVLIDFILNISTTNSICVHIRRGDYITDLEHNICTKQYYLNAMDFLRHTLTNPTFFIFSDDKQWIRSNFDGLSDCIIQDTYNLNNLEEISLMSNCKHFIISNSTFSWWAQYLGTYDKKIVIAPNRWYTTLKPVDIYIKDWIILE